MALPFGFSKRYCENLSNGGNCKERNENCYFKDTPLPANNTQDEWKKTLDYLLNPKCPVLHNNSPSALQNWIDYQIQYIQEKIKNLEKFEKGGD